jgi:hypothetical protein
MRLGEHGLRDDTGNILVAVVLVSVIIGALAALGLRTGTQADFASSSDRNSEIALGVAEAGLHSAIDQINQAAKAFGNGTGGPVPTTSTFSGSTSEGAYEGEWVRCDPNIVQSTAIEALCDQTGTWDGFVLEASASRGDRVLKRGRHVRVSLQPPERIPGHKFALFANTTITLKNRDHVEGDVWANENVITQQDLNMDGSMTAAKGFIDIADHVNIGGNITSGGFCEAQPNCSSIPFAIRLQGAHTIIDGNAKASATDPATCGQTTKYKITGAGRVLGTVTTPGVASIVHDPTKYTQACTPAPTPIKMPVFHFNEINYWNEVCAPSNTCVRKFDGVESFEAYLDSGARDALQGTFLVWDTTAPLPSESNKIDLTNVSLAGNTTLVTNAPITTDRMDDDAVPDTADALLVLATDYQPAATESCHVETEAGDCAIYIKNGFEYEGDRCKTAVLTHAGPIDRNGVVDTHLSHGQVGIKNDSTYCGAVQAEGIQVHNLQTLQDDPRVDRVLGFGPVTYEIGRWEELPVE